MTDPDHPIREAMLVHDDDVPAPTGLQMPWPECTRGRRFSGPGPGSRWRTWTAVGEDGDFVSTVRNDGSSTLYVGEATRVYVNSAREVVSEQEYLLMSSGRRPELHPGSREDVDPDTLPSYPCGGDPNDHSRPDVTERCCCSTPTTAPTTCSPPTRSGSPSVTTRSSLPHRIRTGPPRRRRPPTMWWRAAPGRCPGPTSGVRRDRPVSQRCLADRSAGVVE